MREKIKHFLTFGLIAMYLLMAASGIFYVISMCYEKLRMLISNYDNEIGDILFIVIILTSMMVLFIVFIILLFLSIVCIIEGITGNSNRNINDEYINEELEEVESSTNKKKNS